MRQYLKNEVFKVSKWVELFISAIIMIAVIGGTIYLVKDVVQLMMNYPTSSCLLYTSPSPRDRG